MGGESTSDTGEVAVRRIIWEGRIIWEDADRTQERDDEDAADDDEDDHVRGVHRLFVVSKNAFSSTSNQSLHRRLFVVPSFLQRAPAVEQSSLAQTLPCFAPSCPKHRPNRQSETRQRPWAMLGRTCAQHDVSRGLETSVSGGDITCDREIASKSICGNYSRRASRNISSTSASP